MKFEVAIALIEEKLKGKLPGRNAQYLMAPLQRKTFDDYINEYPDHRKSAVLILIYPDNSNNANVLFIERPSGDHVHSGQIAFPGGRIEENETAADAAKRETEEEVGVPAPQIKILGQLTDLFIPASKFIVSPFAGMVNHIPEFIPSPIEVQSLISITLEEVLNLKVLHKYFSTSYGNISAPYFDIDGFAVWGATAMMTSEFRALFVGSNF